MDAEIYNYVAVHARYGTHFVKLLFKLKARDHLLMFFLALIEGLQI